MNNSPLLRQHLFLRLLIIAIGVVGSLDAKLFTLFYQSALLLTFCILDIRLYAKCLNAVRRSLPIFVGYWLFATLFAVPFPARIIFSTKLVFYIILGVFALGNLTLNAFVRDTAGLRKYRLGEKAVVFVLATILFVRAYAKVFAGKRIKAESNLGTLIDTVIEGARESYAQSAEIESRINSSFNDAASASIKGVYANLIALGLIAMMVILSSI
ncbi:MAG: hypothetical protein Q8M98_06565 [Candidatus Cloacimonadaceae bacterium]|nr:hypothetical protein [Candidatus Cloacimonadaceae bacterium]